jgi:hypothetical protein
MANGGGSARRERVGKIKSGLCGSRDRRRADNVRDANVPEGSLQLIGELTDQHGARAALGNDRSELAKVGPLASSASDQDERLWEGAQCGDHGVGLRRLPVIDETDSIDLTDGLKSMGHAAERCDRGTDRVGRDSRYKANGDGGKHIAYAVFTKQGDLGDGHYAPPWSSRCYPTAISGSARNSRSDDPAVDDAEAAREWRLTAVGNRFDAPLARIGGRDRVVKVHDQGAITVDAIGKEVLNPSIPFNAPVAVKVVNRHVRVDRNINWAHDRRELQLRKFHHDARFWAQRRHVPNEWDAVVPP